ncbi:MAG: hypothetical protein HQK65_03140 [Desulfamplus sp.]|nr:hypothetical protein [Desulfamplus sp.]
MNILDTLKKITHKEPDLRTFCIHTIRFKKFLENARALLDLFEDGREKYLGEYIFDRHYVVSLIDSVVERLGMIVYDASVLIPQKGEELYSIYDNHKLVAKNLISGKGYPEGLGIRGDFTSGTSVFGTPDTYDPEYQLLFNAIRWFNVKNAPENSTVMSFIKYLFFNVTQGLESMAIMKNQTLFEKSGLRAIDMGLYLIDLWKDALAMPEERRSTGDLNCVPLKYLLMKTGVGYSKDGQEKYAKDGQGKYEKEGLGKYTKDRQDNVDKSVNWVAATSEYQLSLNTLKPDFQFRLETLASSDEKSNFIFIFADKSASIEKILPSGFNIENTDYGQFAWSICISAKTIEDSLSIIGRNLFDSNLSRV